MQYTITFYTTVALRKTAILLPRRQVAKTQYICAVFFTLNFNLLKHMPRMNVKVKEN